MGISRDSRLLSRVSSNKSSFFWLIELFTLTSQEKTKKKVRHCSTFNGQYGAYVQDLIHH